MRAAQKSSSPLLSMLRASSAGGVVLMLCAGIALIWANSPLSHGYFALWETSSRIPVGSSHATFSLYEIINDGLMAIFFLFVGLEIKRELLIGELASIRQAALPVVAAFGGMVVPALIFVALNLSNHSTRGWGIPMATDIAFALGVLALLGDRIPASLRVFLSALAIADDLGAVLVIALFYTATISLTALAAAALVLALAILMNATGVRAMWAYALIGIVLWIAILLSGVHPTVAGVLLAFVIPARTHDDGSDSLLVRLECILRTPVTFGILPLFALANAGVSLTGIGHLIVTPVALGVAAGLILGKPIGICLAAWIAVRTGIASIPTDISRRMIFGVALLSGIGFTMSLFVAGLAFGESSDMLTAAKLGTFAASILAGIGGWFVLRAVSRRSS
jgi:NhaA family Na+:H+ antiporter